MTLTDDENKSSSLHGETLETVIAEMREAAKLWRDAYPNGGYGRAAKRNFANWLTAFADRLAALQPPPGRDQG